MNQRVLVALGGGAQSAIAAALLKSEGYWVEGVFFDFTNEGAQAVSPRCQRPDAVGTVNRIAQILEIPMRAESLAG